MKHIAIKKLVLSVLFALIVTLSFSQVYRFRSSSLQLKTKDNYGWTKWSDPTETNILIVFDLDKERVTIFSKETQIYDIYKTYDRVTDSDGDYTYEYACIDAAGLKCHVRWLKLNSQNGRFQIYVDFSDMMWVYNVKFLE